MKTWDLPEEARRDGFQANAGLRELSVFSNKNNNISSETTLLDFKSGTFEAIYFVHRKMRIR